MPGVINKFVFCDICGKFRFIADDMVWREALIQGEFLSATIKRFGKKDICHDCLQKVKRETVVCKIKIK